VPVLHRHAHLGQPSRLGELGDRRALHDSAEGVDVGQVGNVEAPDEHTAVGLTHQQALADEDLEGFPQRVARHSERDGPLLLGALAAGPQVSEQDALAQAVRDALGGGQPLQRAVPALQGGGGDRRCQVTRSLPAATEGACYRTAGPHVRRLDD